MSQRPVTRPLAPNTPEVAFLCQTVDPPDLLTGESVSSRRLCFHEGPRLEETLTVNPTPLLFSEAPQVEFATNTFIDVPVILQVEDQPLIEVFQAVPAGYTTRFRIFNDSGDLLAAVEGSRLIRAEAGKTVGLEVRHEALRTVCSMDGNELFEVSRIGAAALRTAAELYAPDGRFIIGRDGLDVWDSPDGLKVGSATLLNSTIQESRIGILVDGDGSVRVGAN